MGDCTTDEGFELSQKDKMDISIGLTEQIKEAKKFASVMALLSEAQKNFALELLERELRESASSIIAANKIDLENPDNAEWPSALKDRLLLTNQRIMAMANGVRKIINIQDPIGEVLEGWKCPNGLKITKVRVPLGVIGIIYEARPNVTIDAIALAVKSGNALVLRGSKQARNTNLALMEVVTRAFKQTQVPLSAIQYLSDRSREGCMALLRAQNLINLVIPRGGESLNKFVRENSLVPVMGAGGGLCHVYIDQFADINKAVSIAVNAKVSRPSVCNSCETILVHQDVKDAVLPPLIDALVKNDVEIIADHNLVGMFPFVKAASQEDWQTEYLDLKVSIKLVKSIEEAIGHINYYSTKHSEAIITEDLQSAELFKNMIDSACVYVNASTRFTDGEEFGFGGEMGISTSMMHARGPIGARELCTYKFIIEGNGQTR